MSYKVKRAITLPLFKMTCDQAAHVKITSKMFVGKQIGDKQPAVIMHIIDLDTGEAAEMIVNTVLKEILEEVFPADDYVGRGFQLTKHAKKTGKEYHTFSVTELDLGDDD